MNKLNWVQGNKLKLSIPLTIVNMDSGESIPYEPQEGDKVRVFLKSLLRSYEYQPTIEGKTLHIEDNGQLEIGTYSVEIFVTEKGGTLRRSKWNKVIQVHDDNSKILSEFDDFPEYADGAIIEGDDATIDGSVLYPSTIQKTLHWVEGNHLELALPMKIVRFAKEGKTAEDYIPEEGSSIKVVLKGMMKERTFNPEVKNENYLHIVDDGTLEADIYAIEIHIVEPDGTKRRSRWEKVLQIHHSNARVVKQFDDFPDYAEGAIIEGSVFFFVGGSIGGSNNAPIPMPDMSEYATRVELEGVVAEINNDLEEIQRQIEVASNEYESGIADKTLTTPNDVGGIVKGTKVSSLEGKTYAELFDDILFPTVNPKFTAPYASIAWKNYATVQEVGSTGPTVDNFTVSYNAGAINLNGVKQANRGGSHDTANSFVYVNGNAANKTLPTKLALGSTKFKYRAAFNKGPQPKNNKGGNYDLPLAAGTVDSGEISVNGTYPWYATTNAAGTLTKQILVAWNSTAGQMSTGSFEVKSHTSDAPQIFKIPRRVYNLQMYNTVARAFEDVSVEEWTETTSSEIINSVSQTYYTYTYKGSNRGSVILIVKF